MSGQTATSHDETQGLRPQIRSSPPCTSSKPRHCWTRACTRKPRPTTARRSSIWPDHPASLNNLGTAVWRQGRITRPRNTTAGRSPRIPAIIAILNNLGNVLWEQGRLDEAMWNAIARQSSFGPIRPKRS